MFKNLVVLPRAYVRSIVTSAACRCSAVPNTTVDPSEETTEPVGDENMVDQIQYDTQSKPFGAFKSTQSVNLVHLIGRVGVDPVTRGTEMSNVVCFSLATNRTVRADRYSTEGGDPMHKTDWHNVVIMVPGTKQYARNFVRKGDLVSVTGSLIYRSFSPNTIERPVTVPQIRADRLQIVLRSMRGQTELEEPEMNTHDQ